MISSHTSQWIWIIDWSVNPEFIHVHVLRHIHVSKLMLKTKIHIYSCSSETHSYFMRWLLLIFCFSLHICRCVWFVSRPANTSFFFFLSQTELEWNLGCYCIKTSWHPRKHLYLERFASSWFGLLFVQVQTRVGISLIKPGELFAGEGGQLFCQQWPPVCPRTNPLSPPPHKNLLSFAFLPPPPLFHSSPLPRPGASGDSAIKFKEGNNVTAWRMTHTGGCRCLMWRVRSGLRSEDPCCPPPPGEVGPIETSWRISSSLSGYSCCRIYFCLRFRLARSWPCRICGGGGAATPSHHLFLSISAGDSIIKWTLVLREFSFCKKYPACI